MSFDVERFVTTPTVGELNSLKKNELLQLVQHYKLTADASLSKSQVKEVVLKHLIDEEVIPPVETTEETAQVGGMTGEELLQLKRLEFQERDKERAAQLRLKELELRERELALQVQLKELEVRANKGTTVVPEVVTPSFDVSKHIRFVPDFREAEVDKYFLHFEKVAKSLKWPERQWTLLLQSSLVGKAREVYSALSINQTHVEFARIKESLFDRWCTSKEIEENFVKLRQLILVEEFKNCVSCDVKTYLDEKKAQTLKEAAVLADDYVLTHKGMPTQRTSTALSLNQGAPPFIPSNQGPRYVL